MNDRVGPREHKLLLKQLHETGFPGGPGQLDRFFAAEYRAHGLWNDLDGLKASLQAMLDAYPNVEWVIEDMIAEGDKVAVRATLKIRAAAGVMRTVGSTMIYRINANNRIAEQWGHMDALF